MIDSNTTQFLLGNIFRKIHGVNMGPNWVLSAADGPYERNITSETWV